MRVIFNKIQYDIVFRISDSGCYDGYNQIITTCEISIPLMGESWGAHRGVSLGIGKAALSKQDKFDATGKVLALTKALKETPFNREVI